MMDWSKLLHYQDFKLADEGNSYLPEFARTPFQIDFDRIVFSEDFRRLDKKTQVHPLKINDHVHARLTHSLETSCVGRSLGSKVGKFITEDCCAHPYKEWIPNKKNSDKIVPILTGQIVQAACLVHDIGNPPFGHAGEEVIKDWFVERIDYEIFNELTDKEKADLIHFEGNAQAFRVMTRLSMRRNDAGMGLTYAVIASSMKYPWLFYENVPKGKFGCYLSESEYLKRVAEKTGLIERTDINDVLGFARHPFAYLSEASDDICYNIMDLEDAYELGILDYESVRDIFIWLCHGLDVNKDDYKEQSKSSLSRLRAKAISNCVDYVVTEFQDKYHAIMTGKLQANYSLLENSDPLISKIMEVAKKTSKERVFKTERKTLLEIAANQALSVLLEQFCNSTYRFHCNKQREYDKKVLSLMGTGAPKKEDSLYTKYQYVVDYIAGMTDNYAIRLSKNMGGIVD